MISIIVPCYNCENYIGDLINSLDAQTNKNFEVVFVDDCSTDKTYEKLKKIEGKKEYSVVVKKNSVNQGPGNTRNNAISISKGNYITFADSDDYFSRDAINELERAILENGLPDAILFDYVYIKKNKSIKKKTIPNINITNPTVDDVILYSTSSPWGKMYKKDIIVNNKITFPDFKLKEDFVFNKLVLSNCHNIFYLQHSLYNYRYVKTSIMNSYKAGKKPSVTGAAYNILSKSTPPEKKSVFMLLSIRHYLFLNVQNLFAQKCSNSKINNFIDEYTKTNPVWETSYKELKYGKYFDFFMKLISKRKYGTLRIVCYVSRIIKSLI